MLRITGWVVRHVVNGTLWRIGTRYRAVLLGNKPGTRARLRGGKTSGKREGAVLIEVKVLQHPQREQYAGSSLPRRTLSGLLIV